jgi:glycosyltransferase involved in cell wall biosynthesis
MKRILHIIQRSSYDGASVYPLRIINELDEFDHTILAIYKDSAHVELNKLDIKYSYLIKQYSRSYKVFFRQFFLFTQFILKNDFDIIHYHFGGVGILFLAVFFKRNKKIIHHIHSGNIVGNFLRGDLNLVQKLLLKITSNKCYKIAVNNSVIDYYKNQINDKCEIDLIYNFSPYPFNRDIKQLNYQIGYIGRITKEKGVSVFENILAENLNIKQELSFKVKGDNYLPEKESKFFFSKRIIRESPSYNIREFFLGIDLILFLSNAPEGFPLVIIEAMSFNVGVIMLKSKMTDELFKDYPLIVNNTDSKHIGKIIKTFYEDNSLRQLVYKKNLLLFNKYKKQDSLNKLKEIYINDNLIYN